MERHAHDQEEGISGDAGQMDKGAEGREHDRRLPRWREEPVGEGPRDQRIKIKPEASIRTIPRRSRIVVGRREPGPEERPDLMQSRLGGGAGRPRRARACPGLLVVLAQLRALGLARGSLVLALAVSTGVFAYMSYEGHGGGVLGGVLLEVLLITFVQGGLTRLGARRLRRRRGDPGPARPRRRAPRGPARVALVRSGDGQGARHNAGVFGPSSTTSSRSSRASRAWGRAPRSGSPSTSSACRRRRRSRSRRRSSR